MPSNRIKAPLRGSVMKSTARTSRSSAGRVFNHRRLPPPARDLQCGHQMQSLSIMVRVLSPSLRKRKSMLKKSSYHPRLKNHWRHLVTMLMQMAWMRMANTSCIPAKAQSGLDMASGIRQKMCRPSQVLVKEKWTALSPPCSIRHASACTTGPGMAADGVRQGWSVDEQSRCWTCVRTLIHTRS